MKKFITRVIGFWPVTPFIYLLLGIIVVINIFALTLRDHTKLAIVCITLGVFAVVCTVLLESYVRSSTMDYLRGLSDRLSHQEIGTLGSLPVPAVAVRANGEIAWYNAMFSNQLLSGADALGVPISRALPKLEPEKIVSGETFELRHNKCWYSCSCSSININDDEQHLLLFSQITELKQIEQSYTDTRPCVVEIMFDNEEELLKERESERMRIMSEIDSLINGWAAEANGICWANAREKSIILFEHADFMRLMSDKFSILSKARKIQVKEGLYCTLSIGVGYGGKSLAECESWARHALDMALGRGGDQAAVRSPEGYSFFGGVSNSSERQSKVRMRMFASALSELIEQCENLFIMGHEYSDLDSIGASAGVLSLARAMDKESYIVADRTKSPARDLISYYADASGFDRCVLEPSDALDRVRDGSLVVVVDTHSVGNVESPALLNRAGKVVVIDHHRMMVDHITDAALFIQESYASSASELVTELAGYINEKAIRKPEADALLSGIMLDTKNFVLRTGTRTFEASAFLRRRGADTVEAKQYLSGGLDTCVYRSKLIASAFTAHGCVFACADEYSADLRVAAAQAADELLSIRGVDASFVLFPDGDGVNISARSLGKLNVQLIMEELGGGGHLTMAGAQLKNTTQKQALEKIYKALDSVRGKRSGTDNREQ